MTKSKCSICGIITENYRYNRKENKVSCYECLNIKLKPKQPEIINCAICGEPIKWRYNYQLPRSKYNPCWANAESNTAHHCKYNKIAIY